MSGSLRGVKVLDFSTLLPGPLATLFLADAGADVIKVEKPINGEDMRHYPPGWGESSMNFSLLNRGKRSVAIDLKNAEDVNSIRTFVKDVDIVVEQFRPGVMKRLGLDYDSMKRINPRVIYCSITGFGQDGPKKNLAGHDINYIGDAGLLSLSSGPKSQPVVPPALIADIAGGSYPAVINILLALRERDLSGHGCHLDISMTDGVLPFLFWAIGKTSSSKEDPVNGGDRLTGGSPRYRLYPTSDNRIVAAGPLEDKFWSAFTAAIGLDEEFIDDAIDPQRTILEVEKIISSHDAIHWGSIFKEADCCCTIVKTVSEALADEQFAFRGVFDRWLTNDLGEKVPAIPLPIANSLRDNDRVSDKAPSLGDHKLKQFES